MELNLRIENAIPVGTKEGSTINLDKLNCSGIEVNDSKTVVTFHMNNGKFYTCDVTEQGLILTRIF